MALPADIISCWAGANVVDRSPAILRATRAGLAGGIYPMPGYIIVPYECAFCRCVCAYSGNFTVRYAPVFCIIGWSQISFKVSMYSSLHFSNVFLGTTHLS